MKSPFSGHFVKVFPHENLKLIISKNMGWVTLFKSFLKKGEIDDFYQDNFFQTPKKMFLRTRQNSLVQHFKARIHFAQKACFESLSVFRIFAPDKGEQRSKEPGLISSSKYWL